MRHADNARDFGVVREDSGAPQLVSQRVERGGTTANNGEAGIVERANVRASGWRCTSAGT
jgi:hypothetical protein